jgi:hypothetical protein
MSDHDRRYTAAHHDHDRDLRKADWRPGDPVPLDQRLAVAALVGECESIAASGNLTPPAEQSLRLLIAKTLTAFEMPSKAEREIA